MTTLPLGVIAPQLVLLGFIPLVVFILFAVSMQKAMNTVSAPNRKMEGGLVWLNLIPLLNIIWPFIFNNALRESYRQEFSQKGISKSVNLSSGIVYPIGQVITFIIALFQFGILASSSGMSQSDAEFSMLLSVLSALCGLMSFVLWIVFWVNVTALRVTLISNNQMNAYTQSNRQPVFNEPTEHPSSQNNNPEPPRAETPREVEPPKVEPVKQVTMVEKLSKYHEMLSQGLITQADFDRIKNELLNQK